MEIPSNLVANWKREGYTHLHLGGVRLILTLHGRKGLPVTARIALLDTRFKEYQHAVIGTVLTTLHAGSVLLTFYPNFNLSLEDPNLPTTLKVQIQLQGAEQTPTSKIATLHHQIVYRLQNHALDLPTPYTTSDALMILADTDTIPTIIQIPKQIQKQELLKLMPLEWLTNYEHFHQNSDPVQTTEATFDRRPNGQVKLSFQTPDTKPVSDSPQLSYTAMITAVQTGQEKKLPIHVFSSEGYLVYPDKINGHFIWDVPEAHMCNPDCPCLDDTDIEEELEVMRRKKKKKKKSSYPPSSCKPFLPHPPPDPKPPVHPIRSCLMFSSHSYEESFPPLEKQMDTQTRVTSKPFVQSPVTASGQPEEPKQYEAVLNWQTKNASAQNQTLQQLGKKIDRVGSQVSQTETKVDSISSRLDQMYIHLQDRISELDTDLRRMINNHIWDSTFPFYSTTLFTQPQPTPVSPPIFETYAPFYTPSRPQQPVYNQFFGFSHLQPTPQPSSPKKSRSKVKISEPRPKATFSSSTSTIPPDESPQDIPEPLKKDKSPMDQFHCHTVQTQSSDSSDSSEPETNHSTSSSAYDSSKTFTDSESEYADITGILMATETADPSASTSTPIIDDNPFDQASHTDPVPPPVHEHSTKPSSASWFTFDDIPRHKWAARLQEFAAWIDLQGTKPNAQPQAVLREFMARSTGSLRDWLESLGEYKQLQFMESPIGTALNLIHEQFIGEKTAFTETDRKEYHQMKCSLKRHLLDAHYKRMSILFYKLNGFNEPSLKHVLIASLPSELQPDLQRKLAATNLSIADISLGKIFQMAMLSLDKICEQKAFFKDLMEENKRFFEACKLSVRMKRNVFVQPQRNDISRNTSIESPPPKNLFEQSAQDDQTAFLIAESSDSDDISVISTVQTVNHVSTIPRPSLKMSILPSKYYKPIPVIGFIDTGANTSMIDPFVLPSDCWEHHSKLFRAVNGETFETTLITKKPVDINGVRHFCAHACGQFKDSERNYHVIYKEILAVKYGIKKFEFHLINHKFLINMDNSSFPRIFDFKNKLLPDKQLLSLKTWFAKYDFIVQHIKGNQNLIPEFLTRPAINKPALISSIQTIPVIAMNRQLPFKALNQRNFPMNISFQSAYQLQDFAKKFLYRFFFNVQTKKPDCFPNLCMEHLFLIGLTLSSLSISEDELWYMWCLTTLYATKLVFPIRPVLTHLTTLEFSPDLLWTLFEWPYFQHPETRDYWTQDMAYEWRTYPHPYTFIHDTSVSSVLKAYLMELNNVPPPAINIHHTFIGPSHTLEVIPKTQGCTPGSSSSPQGILVMEQRPDYTNVLFQDAQDPWEDFQSLLHTENPHYIVTTPASPTASTSQPMTEVDEDKYQQAEAYLDQRQIRQHKGQYEKDSRDVSPSRYPSTP
ncbi:hypothetical protein KPL71_004250 [Citrus sinensis]|uniref:Uncharacterized protein n=1 Tax=Citrus sinensis TaxID=2711 RepID=A0ACB8N4B5_CITSI|nr:hypothetical protein KPL71_004250 [Citrus sinensis]